MNPPGPGFFFLGRFFITASVSFLIIDLFRFSIFSWFDFSRSYISRNLSILFRFSNLLECNCSNYHLVIHSFGEWNPIWISVASAVMSFTFIFNFIKLGLFTFWLVWLRVCESCLPFQRTKSLFHWSFVFLVWFPFLLILVWSFLFLSFY
jgi:hypothetical protein